MHLGEKKKRKKKSLFSSTRSPVPVRARSWLFHFTALLSVSRTTDATVFLQKEVNGIMSWAYQPCFPEGQ